jgi:hypothetical protein
MPWAFILFKTTVCAQFPLYLTQLLVRTSRIGLKMQNAVCPSSFFLLPVDIEKKSRIITTTISSAEIPLMPSCSCFRGYRQLSGGSHGNIEEEQ